jgi:hypothetical protein
MAAMVIAETMFRGDCRLLRIQVIDEETEDPVGSLSGWNFFCTGKVSHDDTDAEAVFQLTLGGGIEVIDNINSIIEITIPPAAIAALLGATTRLYIDAQATDTNGVPWTLGAGRLTIRGDVTRST